MGVPVSTLSSRNDKRGLAARTSANNLRGQEQKNHEKEKYESFINKEGERRIESTNGAVNLL